MRAAVLLLLGAVVLGCTEKPSPPPPTAGTRPAAKSGAAYQPVAMTNAWEARPQLVSVTYDQWMRELQALHGRVVVVDNWATWCAPCVERFPRTIELARAWPRSEVAFITLSLDDRDDPASIGKARAFLEKQGARFPNYLMNEITPDAFDKLGLLGIPAVFIYDRNGRLVQRLTGDDPNHQYREEDVEAAVRKLVAAK